MFVRHFISFFLGVLLISVKAYAQPVVDSLNQKLQEAATEEQKIKIMLELSGKLTTTNLAKAMEYASEAVQRAKKVDSDSLLMAAYRMQGNIYFNLGSYSKALQLYQEVIQGGEKISDHYMVAITNANVGAIYYFERDHEKALRYYLRGLNYINQMKGKADRPLLIRKANLLNNIVIVYEETARFDSAILFYTQGLKLAEQLNEHETVANALNNFGTLYRDQGDMNKALDYYTQALSVREKNKNRLGIARSSHNLGTFYFENIKDNGKAEPYLKRAIEIGTEVGSWQTVASASNLLHQLYRQEGEYQKAYETLELSRKVNDSLFNEENTRKIAQLEMQAEFDKKQSLQEARQKEKELYFLMGASALVFLLIIVTLLFILQRSKTKRSELEQAHLELEKAGLKNDLALKDQELATNIMYLINKNELINHLSEKLLAIKHQSSPEMQPSIQKVILDIQSNLQPELWQEFEFRFQQVHEQFYKILNERFPDLTPSERRLCAFLKLNMSTKEISAITHQNAKSIDVARTRLRKKLNLTGTDHNLVSFLSQLGVPASEKM
jgi:tetratricopeptide (TPR) repeat protein